MLENPGEEADKLFVIATWSQNVFRTSLLVLFMRSALLF